MNAANKQPGKMRLVYMNPKKIRIPAVRVTSAWDPEDYEVFKRSLEADGQQDPILCVKEGENFWLCDGRHRLEEALLRGDLRIAVAYREGTLTEAKCRNLYINRLRGKTKASEEVTLIKDLRENDGLSLEEISSRTGMPMELIEQRLAVGKAEPYVLECLDNERIGIGLAFELSRLPNPKGQVRLLQEILVLPKMPPTKWVHDIIEESLKIIRERAEIPEVEEPTIPIRTIRCHMCEQRYSENEIRGFNICISCAGVAKDYIKELMRKRKEEGTPEQELARRVATES